MFAIVEVVKVNAVVYFRVMAPLKAVISGVKVTQVAVKTGDPPLEMQRAMAKQAEAEREKRAQIIHASGELEASKHLAEAAGKLSAEPVPLHPRYLQTLVEFAAEKNSTVIFPVPIDWMKALMGARRE